MSEDTNNAPDLSALKLMPTPQTWDAVFVAARSQSSHCFARTQPSTMYASCAVELRQLRLPPPVTLGGLLSYGSSSIAIPPSLRRREVKHSE